MDLEEKTANRSVSTLGMERTASFAVFVMFKTVIMSMVVYSVRKVRYIIINNNMNGILLKSFLHKFSM